MTGGSASLGDAVYERLLRERIVFLGREVDDVIANQLAAQMLLLSAEEDDPLAQQALVDGVAEVHHRPRGAHRRRAGGDQV